jgi:E3 ubiquitin-protein ligase UBR1
MSLTSLFPSFRTPRDRVPQAPPTSDPLYHLRLAFETMPGSRGYQFTPATRKEILKELCNSFWGANSGLFLGSSSINFSDEFPISEAQFSAGYGGAAQDDPVIPGRPCGHIFKKGESCFRCK